jgi:hypothetical protein
MSKHEIENTPQDRIQYREYKITLQAQHFTSAQAFVGLLANSSRHGEEVRCESEGGGECLDESQCA